MPSSRSPDYQSLEITDAAQRVQRSAYPDAYAQHEVMARAFASSLTGQTAAGLDCSLRAPDAGRRPCGRAGTPVPRTLAAVPASTEGSTLVLEAEGTQAWAVAQWAVANAKALSITEVQADGRSWTRQDRNGWQPAEVPAGQVRVTVAGAPAP